MCKKCTYRKAPDIEGFLSFSNCGTRIRLRGFSTGGWRLGASDSKYRANRVMTNPLKPGRVRYFPLLPGTGNVLTFFFRSNRQARFLNLKTNFKNFSPFVLHHKLVMPTAFSPSTILQERAVFVSARMSWLSAHEQETPCPSGDLRPVLPHLSFQRSDTKNDSFQKIRNHFGYEIPIHCDAL